MQGWGFFVPMGIDFLLQVAAVVAAGLPVFVMLVGLCTTAVGIWATFRAASSVTVGIANSFSDIFDELGSWISSFNSSVVSWLMDALSVSTLCTSLATSLSVISGLLVAFAGIFGVIIAAGFTVWLYRKARLFANVVSGSGVQE